jgi:hypothetical protein
MNERVDNEATLELKRKYPQAKVLKHREVAVESRDIYLLADRILIDRKGPFTCPLQSFAIFVHNRDIKLTSEGD